MNKRIISILFTILVISIIANITVYAATPFIDQDVVNEKNSIIEAWEKRSDVQQQIKFSINNEQKELQYDQTHNINRSKAIDVYRDEINDEYRFNASGDLVGYFNANASIKKGSNTTELTETDIVETAKEHINQLFGKKFDAFTFDFCLSLLDDRQYMVCFSMKYGKDNFITGPSVVVTVSNEGSVLYSNYPDMNLYEGFDSKTLNNIDENDVKSDINEQVSSAFGKSLISYVIEKIELIIENDQFILRVPVSASLAEYDEGAVFYYEIEQ